MYIDAQRANKIRVIIYYVIYVSIILHFRSETRINNNRILAASVMKISTLRKYDRLNPRFLFILYSFLSFHRVSFNVYEPIVKLTCTRRKI